MSEVSIDENHLDESPRGMVIMAVVGVAVGILSGLFGIGGGTIIVPALVWLGLTQRHAAATSMMAIVPTAVSGVVSYAVEGDVDWIAAAIIFAGMFVGGQIGSWLLSKLPELVLRWAFVLFLVFVIVNQAMSNPSRDSTIHMHAGTIVGLIVFGVIAGVLAGLLGIGGGAICVPALSIIFGASDLIARHVVAGHVPERDHHIRGERATPHGACQGGAHHRHCGCGDGAARHMDGSCGHAAHRRDPVHRLPVRVADSVHLGRHQSHTPLNGCCAATVMQVRCRNRHRLA